MIDASAFIKKVINDYDLFWELYVKAETVVMKVKPKGDEFGVGFLIGFWLGRYYGNQENTGICASENSDRRHDS